MRLRMHPTRETINGHETITIGPACGGRRVHVDPTDREWTRGRWIFVLEHHTYVLAHGSSFEAALETAITYALDRWPGLDGTEDVAQAYREGIMAGMTEDQAWDASAADAYATGDGRWYTDEWTYIDCPTRTALEDICYPPGVRWDDRDSVTVTRPEYRPTRREIVVVQAPTHSDLWSDVVCAVMAADMSERGRLAIMSAIGDM